MPVVVLRVVVLTVVVLTVPVVVMVLLGLIISTYKILVVINPDFVIYTNRCLYGKKAIYQEAQKFL